MYSNSNFPFAIQKLLTDENLHFTFVSCSCFYVQCLVFVISSNYWLNVSFSHKWLNLAIFHLPHVNNFHIKRIGYLYCIDPQSNSNAINKNSGTARTEKCKYFSCNIIFCAYFRLLFPSLSAYVETMRRMNCNYHRQ